MKSDSGMNVNGWYICMIKKMDDAANTIDLELEEDNEDEIRTDCAEPEENREYQCPNPIWFPKDYPASP